MGEDDTGNSSSKKARMTVDPGEPKARNVQLAELFKRLSTAYQVAPLFHKDEMRARSFHKIAGRLRHQHHEIEDEQTLWKIAGVDLVGSTAIRMIREYLQSGSIARIHSLENDKTRIALKNIMGIWGVGRATVGRLFHD
jgi:DNA polymerase/3'-5' exonuclease PolX